MKEGTRKEKDSLGEVILPRDAAWGAQTQRAVDNFGISSRRIPLPLLRMLALIKAAYARGAEKENLYDPQAAGLIAKEAERLAEEPRPEDFPVDVYQTGSGTSWNMNINEVLARRVNLRGELAHSVHPNDHVNRGQSSNDVIPAAIQGACRLELPHLIAEVDAVSRLFFDRSRQWRSVLKLGRTHLQDALPLSLGDEMEAYGEQMCRCSQRLAESLPRLEDLPLGGTAQGTGLNCPPELAASAIGYLRSRCSVPFRQAPSLFEALSCRDDQVELAGKLNTLATALMKISQDLRLMSSGPRGGLGELMLPALQPGSSIMPGKVNPVLPEMMLQVAARVMGSAVTVTIAGQTGPLEINIMQPLIGAEILDSLELLTRGLRRLRKGCLEGMVPREETCRAAIEQSLAMVTPLAVKLGYEKAAKLAQKAWDENLTIREVVTREKLFSPQELDQLLDPAGMVSSGTGTT